MITSQKKSPNERQKKYYNKHKDDEKFKIKNRMHVKKYVDDHKDDPIYKERRKRNLQKYNNKPEIKIKLKNHYNNDKERFKTKSIERYRKIRLEVLKHYSNGEMKCKMCDESHIEFLEIDHINGGGHKHRKKEKFTSLTCYLKRNNFPEGYQILCSNCNIKKVKIASRDKGLNGTKLQQYHYRYYNKLKLDVLSHYALNDKIKCSCQDCDEDDIDKLCLDHINGEGTKHRKELSKNGVVGSNIYIWIKKNNYPPIFRILCHNCNQSLGNYGYCPHNKL